MAVVQIFLSYLNVQDELCLNVKIEIRLNIKN